MAHRTIRRTLIAAVVALTPLLISTIGPAPQSATAAPSTESYIAANVLYRMNAERHAHGLAPLQMYGPLVTSATRHNRVMADYNTLSHQLPGEQSLGARVSATGFHWISLGENIAWNGAMNLSGALAAQTMMYDEAPPNDIHRLNILNPNFNKVGVAVELDTVRHKLWLTEDFGR
ncbi:MAG: CAP domain-containing protein [Actinomycetota bacterium]|nr:CAP domain-containing protein [Actinomycetota bacterium]